MKTIEEKIADLHQQIEALAQTIARESRNTAAQDSATNRTLTNRSGNESSVKAEKVEQDLALNGYPSWQNQTL